MNCNIVVKELSSQSRYYVHFWKCMNSLITPQLCIKLHHCCFSSKIALAFDNPGKLKFHKTTKPKNSLSLSLSIYIYIYIVTVLVATNSLSFVANQVRYFCGLGGIFLFFFHFVICLIIVVCKTSWNLRSQTNFHGIKYINHIYIYIYIYICILSVVNLLGNWGSDVFRRWFVFAPS